MTAEDNGYIIGSLALTALLMPAGIIMLSAFLLGDINTTREMAYVCYVVVAFIAIVVVIGIWIERRR